MKALNETLHSPCLAVVVKLVADGIGKVDLTNLLLHLTVSYHCCVCDVFFCSVLVW